MVLTMTRIAILGLGAMGARMARRLIDAGHELTVYNRSPDRAESLVSLGAHRADTPKEAVGGAEVVLTMLTDDQAAKSVWLDEQTGILAGIAENTVALECSTVTPSWIRTLFAILEKRRVSLLDAPVAGSRPQAETGQLIFLIGGPGEALERVRPVIDVMAGSVHHVGPSGAGAWMKLAVNSLFGAQVAVVAELLGMLDKAGIPPDQAMSTLGQLPITSPAAKGVGGLIVAGKYDPLFPIDLVEKDFRYALEAANSVESTVPVTDAVHRVYVTALQAGHGEANINGVAKLYLE